MKKKWLFILVCTIAVSFSTTAVWSADFCVVPNGSGETSLQGALDIAGYNSQNDTIRVVQGTYTGSFAYEYPDDYSLTLEGGYAPGCGAREVNPANTILDGGESDRVLLIQMDSPDCNITVDGFTIQNGNAPLWGTGLRASFDITSGTAGDILISNNIIKGNTNTTYAGGGLYAASTGSGTGHAGPITLINNIIAGNTATASNGGGAYIRSYSANSSGETITLLNNTITDNSAPDSNNGSGGGIYIEGDDNTINIFNNIIWDNTAGYFGDDIAFSYNDTGTKNGFYNDYNDLEWDSGETSWDLAISNIDADPMLNSKYHLRRGSPCIDTATNVIPGSPSTDIDGDARVIDGDRNDEAITDIGADEYVPKGILSFFMLLFD